MPKTKKKAITERTADSEELTLLKKITRLLEILVRLDVQNTKGDQSQNDMIFMLDSLGCGSSEIAKVLGTSTNTVSVALSRKRAGKK